MSIFKKRLRKDLSETIGRYYRNPLFALIDLSFSIASLFANPYRTSRKFLQKKGEKEIYAYGETPFTTYERIAEQSGIGSKDTWIELGSGRGKGCFWLACFIQCKVIGIEQIPSFVLFARLIQKIFRIKNVEFRKERVEKADLTGSTAIYLYGIWPELNIPRGAKVITVGEPLDSGKVIKTFWVRYPWGRTEAFLHRY